MEHTLGETKLNIKIYHYVLILVLVEHTLGALIPDLEVGRTYSLNPCFSGTYSRSAIYGVEIARKCLNPCFSGTYSRRFLLMRITRVLLS